MPNEPNMFMFSIDNFLSFILNAHQIVRQETNYLCKKGALLEFDNIVMWKIVLYVL